ncbi:DUF3035 domain-containing protein [Sphingomonas solaris]|uniref:DUF3035 domain-containing protein n=1 Tax=Alterirhizorhabdus solaris TaxID=2529389 RepID=A0A558R4T0_9SPHN|nr:DUF3035 domain-containing protein [Sphingomonas solaris]TVV74393.1 DUF3035 domain-containing protein [Sphingomonas solaris]
MRKLVISGVAATALLALSACGGGPKGGVFGHAGKGPDEFAVQRQAPLVIPPDFALVPPRPGAPRPQEADSSTQALQAMFGGAAPRSTAETGAIDRAGGARAAGGIRSNAADPATNVVDKGSVTRDIIAAPTGNGPDATVSTPQ